jgi:Tfp pilus assembly protein PilF
MLLFQVYKGAVEDLTMALRIDKTCSFAHYNRGVCYQQLKEYELVRFGFSLFSFHVI